MPRRRSNRDKQVQCELPPTERFQHGMMERDRRGVEGRKIGEVSAAREKAPLVLDRLYWLGKLGPVDSDKTRVLRAAGEWLHDLYHKTGLGNGVSADYQARGLDASPGQSEAQMWNEKCYHETMRAVRPFDGLLSSLCCHNEEPRFDGDDALICRGLRKLAKHRGLTSRSV